MALKRPAETELTGPGRPAPNPFAGVSLFASPSPSGSLFTSAAPAPDASFPSFSSFSSSPGFSSGNSFPSSSAPQPEGANDKGKSTNQNPFMGLSLFSSQATSGSSASPASSGGGLFASAASAFTGTSDSNGQGFASLSKPTVREGDGDSCKPKPDGKAMPDSQKTSDSAECAEPEEEVDAAEGDAEAAHAGPTGEEDEEVLFRNDCKLWKLVKDGAGPAASADEKDGKSKPPAQDNGWRWQERGCGVLHLNRHRQTGGARLVMRMRGVLKILLNTPVLKNTKYEKVGQKSIRFVGVESEDASTKVCSYRVNLQNVDQQGRFLEILKPFL